MIVYVNLVSEGIMLWLKIKTLESSPYSHSFNDRLGKSDSWSVLTLMTVTPALWLRECNYGPWQPSHIYNLLQQPVARYCNSWLFFFANFCQKLSVGELDSLNDCMIHLTPVVKIVNIKSDLIWLTTGILVLVVIMRGGLYFILDILVYNS